MCSWKIEGIVRLREGGGGGKKPPYPKQSSQINHVLIFTYIKIVTRSPTDISV